MVVFAFSVKHEQKMDCGGGYAKLLPPGIDVNSFNGDTDYTLMFGPDICGYSTKKVQAIFNFEGENLLKNADIKCSDDEYTHSYLIVVNKDNTYEIRVDGEEKAKGQMKDDWSFEKPKKLRILRIENQMIGMMNLHRLLIQKLQNRMIGMMKKMVNGKHRKLIIQTIKVNGEQRRYQIRIIRDHGYIQRLIIQNMWKQKMFIREDRLDMLVSKYGRLRLAQCLAILF